MRSIIKPSILLNIAAIVGSLTSARVIAQNSDFLVTDNYSGNYLNSNFDDGFTREPITDLEATADTFAAPNIGSASNSATLNEDSGDTAQTSSPLGPRDLSYHFKFRGLPGQFIYQLHWDEGREPLKRITIVEAKSSEIFQILTMPADLTLTIADLLESKSWPVHVLDYNFDRFPDLRVLQTTGSLAGQKRHLIYLLDTADMKYRLHDELSQMPTPQINAKDQQVVSTELGAYAGSEFVRSYYGWKEDGSLELQTVVKQTMRDRGRMTWHRNVSTLVDGTMTKVCQLIIRGPGRATVVWDGLRLQGAGKNCDIYRNKKRLPRRY